uniref:Uncharacterized protein n=1 Tax=Salix viminalis TaxID=40686 RepID=A0A6N2KFT5_SALVM
MAEGEPLALTYIPEVILKKRKHKEESIALTRKNQLELGQHGGKKKKVDDIKRPNSLSGSLGTSKKNSIQNKEHLIQTEIDKNLSWSLLKPPRGIRMLQKVEHMLHTGRMLKSSLIYCAKYSLNLAEEWFDII